MPRKMYRNPEAEPTPERPGSGSPDDSGVRRRPRKEEKSVLIDPEYQRAVERVKSKESSVIVESSYQEEIGRSKRARKSAEKPKEETLPLEEARARFEAVEQELKEVGVTSEADKMNDPEWSNAYMAFRHAERASRAERSKRGVREYKEAQSQREERHAGHQAAVRELVEDAEREESAKHEGVRENVDELLGMERERMAEEAKLARRERLAGMKKQVDEMRASLLKQEQADLAERMEKMGGVWAGEEYFKLKDRLEDVDAEIEKLEGAERKPRASKREAPVRATQEEIFAGELTPEDEIVDARKTSKFINDSEKEIAARQKKLQRELGRHGIESAAHIDAELAEMEPELRAASTGAKPDVWYRLKKVGRRLAGLERPPEVQALLKRYVNLENEMNAHIHSRAEAEAELVLAEKKAGRERFTAPRMRGSIQGRQTMSGLRGGVADVSAGGDLSGFGKTFLEAPEMRRGSKELRTTLALKQIEEDIRNALGEMEAMQELTETELSEEMFEEKKSNFAKRIRALEEQGESEAFDEALEEAEEALMRYVMAVHQRRRTFFEQARTAGKGEARPASVISIRSGRAGGAYAPGTADRSAVLMSRMETADSREERVAAEKREAAEAPERVNKEVEMYRSVKWRKDLIDMINTDENARAAMHGVYEAFKHRMLEKLANEEDVDFRTSTPDPALDYALNFYRKYAQTPDDKGYVYDLKIRHAAHEELEEIERILGKKWNKSGWAAQAVRAISRGKVELLEGEGADVIPLPHVKRALSEEELEEVEELDIPITVEAPVSDKERPVVSAETAEREALAESSERQREIDEEAEQSFEASLGGFRPAGEALKAEAAEDEELGVPTVQELAAMREVTQPEASQAEGLSVEEALALPKIEPAIEVPQTETDSSEPEVVHGKRRGDYRWEPPQREGARQIEKITPLTEPELAYLKESLNRRVLALGNEWKTVAPEVKGLLRAKHGWIEEYAILYQQYREGKAFKSIRRTLERVNELLGIEKPSDLIVPPSPELRNAVSQEVEEAERAFARAKEKSKKASEKAKAQPTTKTPGQIITMSQVMEGIARKKAAAPAAEEPTEGQVLEREKGRKRLRGRKKAGT